MDGLGREKRDWLGRERREGGGVDGLGRERGWMGPKRTPTP